MCIRDRLKAAANNSETLYEREPGYAERYRDRRFVSGTGRGTHSREVRAIRRLLRTAGSTEPSGAWLDMPCGAGRLTAELPGELAVQADRDPGMVTACRGQGFACSVARAAALPFADGCFEGALSMRLLHHISDQTERVAILRELRRVTDGPLIVSFFHSISFQHLRRTLRRKLRGRRNTGRTAIRWSQFRADLDAAGWAAHTAVPLRRFVSEQWIVLAMPR